MWVHFPALTITTTEPSLVNTTWQSKMQQSSRHRWRLSNSISIVLCSPKVQFWILHVVYGLQVQWVLHIFMNWTVFEVTLKYTWLILQKMMNYSWFQLSEWRDSERDPSALDYRQVLPTQVSGARISPKEMSIYVAISVDIINRNLHSWCRGVFVLGHIVLTVGIPGHFLSSRVEPRVNFKEWPRTRATLSLLQLYPDLSHSSSTKFFLPIPARLEGLHRELALQGEILRTPFSPSGNWRNDL